jgi:hypothetical protein
MPRRRLSAEPLEDRTVPVVWNNPWADPEHLTLSFAPNGTDIRGRASTLFSELNPIKPDVWQREGLRAFQSWAAAGNINLSVMPDAGVPFGTPGPIQGDPRHGDIRLGAANLGDGEFAATTPFDLFGGWSGSVLLNTAQGFNLGGTDGKADLYTVLLQEAGHVFGVGNSPDPASAMYEAYQGPRAGLSAGDVADLQALYGRREPDQFDARRSNNTIGRATPLQFAGPAGPLPRGLLLRPTAADGDLTTAADVDYYSIRVPAGVEAFTARLRTSGISLLTARLTVLDAAGRVVGSAVATDPMAGDLTVAVTNARPGSAYYLRVEGAQDDVFGIGAYRLAAGVTAAGAVAGPATLATKAGGTSTVSLGLQTEGRDRRWDFAFRAGLANPAETDTYTVRTRLTTPDTLVVAVWGLQPGGLDPTATVVDQTGRPVAAEVLTDDGDSYTLQVRGVRPNTTYAVLIAAADPTVATNRGEYLVGIDFRANQITRLQFAAGALTAGQPAAAATMTVAQSQLLHFALAAVTADDQADAGVRLSIRDDHGREVFALVAGAGQTESGDVLLAGGDYQVVIAAGTRWPWENLPDVGFTLAGLVRNDPIGITPIDPTGAPAEPPPPPPPPETTETKPFDGPFTGPYRPFWLG